MMISIRSCTALVGSAVLAAVPVAVIGADSGLVVDGVTPVGPMLAVGVVNAGDTTLDGIVAARLLTTAGEVEVSAAITVPGGQKAFVQMGAPGPIVEVIQVGVVVDDGSPF